MGTPEYAKCMCLYKVYAIFHKIIVYVLVTVYLVYEKCKMQKVVVAFYLSIMLNHIQLSQQTALYYKFNPLQLKNIHHPLTLQIVIMVSF